ncbi:MAG: SDR family NAD(P)-dependent oxidoreductase [Gammaproteobacteria bacterium]
MSQVKTVRGNEGKAIWVTGASSGLGRSMALALAAKGHRVIASARNKKALVSLEKLSPNILALPCDITDEDSMNSARLKISTDFTCLDQVILNAGSCEYLEFPNPDWSTIRRVMEVNYFGTLNCLQIALPLLRQSSLPRPHIVAVASQVTNAPFPKAEAYGASKAALQYFFDSLRIDLAPENIDVSVVNPGFVDTPLTRENDFDMPFLMDVDDAAQRIVNQIESRPRNYSFPKRLRALLLISRLMPQAWQKLVSRDISKSEPNTPSSQDIEQ